MIAENIQLILLITGLATTVILLQFIAPVFIVRLTYGEVITTPVAIGFARNWALGVFCIGALLIYSAFHAELRPAAMLIASIGKTGFILWILSTPMRKRATPLLMAFIDTLMVLLYLFYYIGT